MVFMIDSKGSINMKKCKFCTADMEDNEINCSYCGKNQDSEVLPVIENNNNQEVVYNNQPEEKKNKTLFILLLVSICICMFACFLPFFKVENYSINYIYNESLTAYSKSGGIADGIFIMIFGIISIITLIKKKRIPVVIFQILSASVFFYDYFHAKSNIFNNLLTRYYSIGFYLLFIFLIICVILSILRLVLKNKFE